MMVSLAKRDEKIATLFLVGTREIDQELFYHQTFEEEMKYQLHLEENNSSFM